MRILGAHEGAGRAVPVPAAARRVGDVRHLHQEVRRLRRGDPADQQDRPAAARARRRQDPRRDRRRGARLRGRPPRAPSSRWASTRASGSRSRPTSPARSCPRPCSARSTSRWRSPRAPTSGESLAGRARPSSAPRSSIEVEKVLSDLYPLLRTVQPADLNMTLNAIATALEGRGEQLGENLETLDSYLKRLNPQIPQILDDLRLTAQVSDTYADVMPRDRARSCATRSPPPAPSRTATPRSARCSPTSPRSPTPRATSSTTTATT